MNHKTNLRIAFTGASGTGKTTLARMVSEHYGLPMEQWPVPDSPGEYESTTRHVARMLTGDPEPYKVDALGLRGEFQRKLLATKIAWEQDHAETGFVTDRTHFDNLAYGALHDIDDSATDPEFFRLVRDNMYTYDLIIFCPTGRVPFELDAVRKNSVVYHKLIEAMLHGLYAIPEDRGLAFWPIGYIPEHLSDKTRAFAEVKRQIDVYAK